MTLPPSWDPSRAVRHRDIVPIKQSVWRGHRRRYDALGHGGSLRLPGRFHRTTGDAPEASWPALYTGLDLAVALGELQRNVRLGDLGDYRFTELWVQFEAVLDCRDLESLGISEEILLDDLDYTAGQSLAEAACALGAEGMLVPSATRLGDNLIIFPRLIKPGSVLVALRAIDPRLEKGPRL